MEDTNHLAPPPGAAMAPRPATGQVLPPNTADLVTQSMRCVNSTNGEKGLLMKLRHLGPDLDAWDA